MLRWLLSGDGGGELGRPGLVFGERLDHVGGNSRLGHHIRTVIISTPLTRLRGCEESQRGFQAIGFQRRLLLIGHCTSRRRSVPFCFLFCFKQLKFFNQIQTWSVSESHKASAAESSKIKESLRDLGRCHQTIPHKKTKSEPSRDR